MNNEQFNAFLEKIFSKAKDINNLNNVLLSDVSETELQDVNNYIMNNLNNDIKIEVYTYEKKDNYIFLKTELGTFVLDNNYTTKELENFVNKKYNLFHFFQILFNNNLNYSINPYNNEVSIKENIKGKKYLDPNIILLDYLKIYYTYRMITNPEFSKRLFINLKSIDLRAIPLENFDNPNFNCYIHTDYYHTGRLKLKEIYENYYRYDNNPYLVFSMILLNEDYKKVTLIKNNLEVFKKFIFEECCSNAAGNLYAKLAFDYLKITKLIDQFTEEERILLYKKNPITYYKVFPELYLETIKQIPNNSPMIRLNSREEIQVNIQYHDYDTYETSPIDILKKSKDKTNIPFLTRFLHANNSIVKFYKIYYKSYQRAIANNPQKDNLEDFIKNLLMPKNLLNIFESSKFTWEDINNLIKFKVYYDQEVTTSIEKVKIICRKRSLEFYNSIVSAKNNEQQLEQCLMKYNLTKDNIYEYIINDKFLYSKEKSGLLRIINIYYGNYIKVLDILLLLDEMLTRNITIEEILSEKNILKSDFQKLYQLSKESNPILYQCIFETLNKNSRRGYIKLIRLGYKVLNTDLKSLEEYELKFGKAANFSHLLSGLENTSLYNSLLEKATTWKNFNSQTIKIKTKKKEQEQS